MSYGKSSYQGKGWSSGTAPYPAWAYPGHPSGFSIDNADETPPESVPRHKRLVWQASRRPDPFYDADGNRIWDGWAHDFVHFLRQTWALGARSSQDRVKSLTGSRVLVPWGDGGAYPPASHNEERAEFCP